MSNRLYPVINDNRQCAGWGLVYPDHNQKDQDVIQF